MPSQEQLIELVKAKAARGTCPWCDANDWTIASGTTNYAAILLANVEGIASNDGLETLPFSCKNCGYVQLHLTSALEKGPEHS